MQNKVKAYELHSKYVWPAGATSSSINEVHLPSLVI